jgi:hypothetical protein
MLGLTKHADVKVHGDVKQVAHQLLANLKSIEGNHKDANLAKSRM